jgi:acetoin utilization protein AcuC
MDVLDLSRWQFGITTGYQGRDLTAYDPDDVRAVITGCAQDPHIFDASIRDNLRLARPGGRARHLPRADHRQRRLPADVAGRRLPTRKEPVMTCTLRVAWDSGLTRYDFGPQHPMAPLRLQLTMELAQAFGLLRLDGVSTEVPAAATDSELSLVHDPLYLAMVRLGGSQPGGWTPAGSTGRALLMHGLGTEDDPLFPGMHEAAAAVAGATLAAARAVWTGQAQHGASIAGGLHHAMAGRASGFCVYNDPAVAIAWLLGQGAERVAYLDVDAHHGDGVQAAFWDDPRVLTISMHEHPATLFPGTGFPSETGGPGAEGGAVNLALPAGTRDAGWLRGFHAVVPPLLREFKPQILVSQHGCDSHWSDPRAVHAEVHALAHEVAGGRWLLTGGGGYEHVQVVPRSWAHLLFEAAGCPLEPGARVPGLWREYVGCVTGQAAPELMTEGGIAHHVPFEDGYDPGEPVDRAIMATRKAVFPLHGLTP